MYFHHEDVTYVELEGIRILLTPASVLIGTAAFATAFFVAQPAFAGTATIIDVEQGATPFMAYAGALYYGTNIANVSYSIVPKSGSVTRPFGASYSASYLSSHNFFIPNGNAVIIPVFGLYAGSANTVNVSYTFTDGTVNTQQFTITTPTYNRSLRGDQPAKLSFAPRSDQQPEL